MESRRSKHQRLDKRDNAEENGLDNEEENGLDKNEGKIEANRYILPLFVLLSPLLQKMSNRPSDLG